MQGVAVGCAHMTYHVKWLWWTQR